MPQKVGIVDVRQGFDCEIVMPSNLYECTLGDEVRVGPFCEIQEECLVGNGSVIQSHSFIAAGTIIGSDVFIGHGVITCNDPHPVPNNPYWTCNPPLIEDSVSVGSGAIILAGVRIGKGAVIGAGAVVTKDVPAGVTIIGRH